MNRVRKIAVVDDDEQTRLVVEKYLSEEVNYIVEQFESGDKLIDYLKTKSVDLILLDIEMPGLSGIQTIEKIRHMNNMNAVPVVFLTGKEDRETVLRAIGKGADGYLVKPVNKQILVEKIAEILNKLEQYGSNRTILMIDDDAEFLKIAKIKLSKFYKVLTVNSGKTAIDYLISHKVDVIILDYFMPLYNGNSILHMLKVRESTKNIPVIMASSLDKEQIETACENNPPDGILSKPVSLDDLLNMIQRILDR